MKMTKEEVLTLFNELNELCSLRHTQYVDYYYDVNDNLTFIHYKANDVLIFMDYDDKNRQIYLRSININDESDRDYEVRDAYDDKSHTRYTLHSSGEEITTIYDAMGEILSYQHNDEKPIVRSPFNTAPPYEYTELDIISYVLSIPADELNYVLHDDGLRAIYHINGNVLIDADHYGTSWYMYDYFENTGLNAILDYGWDNISYRIFDSFHPVFNILEKINERSRLKRIEEEQN